MTDLQTRVADVVLNRLADYGITINPEVAASVAASVSALPGVAMVDLADVDPIAKVMAQNWPDTYAHAWPWSDIPERDREAYRQQARAALGGTA